MLEKFWSGADTVSGPGGRMAVSPRDHRNRLCPVLITGVGRAGTDGSCRSVRPVLAPLLDAAVTSLSSTRVFGVSDDPFT